MTYLKLIDGRNNFARRVIQEFLEMSDLKVGYSDIPHLSCLKYRFHFFPTGEISMCLGALVKKINFTSLPCFDKVPIR